MLADSDQVQLPGLAHLPPLTKSKAEQKNRFIPYRVLMKEQN